MSMILSFSPRAWAKLLYMRTKGKTEVGGFGICPYDEHPLYVDNFVLVGQDSGPVSVDHDSKDIIQHAKRFGKELATHQYMGVWMHTHPGFSANPSGIDIAQCEAFKRDMKYFVMFILGNANSGQDDVTCRLFIKTDLGYIEKDIPCRVAWEDYLTSLDMDDTYDAWDQEYETLVRKKPKVIHVGGTTYENWKKRKKAEKKHSKEVDWDEIDWSDKQQIDNLGWPDDIDDADLDDLLDNPTDNDKFEWDARDDFNVTAQDRDEEYNDPFYYHENSPGPSKYLNKLNPNLRDGD